MAPIGAAYAICVGYGLIAIVSHYPSDVLGGYVMAGDVDASRCRRPVGRRGALAGPQRREPLGGSRRCARGTPSRRRRRRRVAALAIAGLVAVARPAETLVYLQDHTAFGVVAVAIATFAAALVATLAAALTARVAVPGR